MEVAGKIGRPANIPPGVARGTESPTIPAGWTRLPATRCGDLFFVEAEIEELRGLHLLVDTGAEVSVLDRELHRQLAGSGRATGSTATGSGGVTLGIEAWRRVGRLGVGGFQWRDVDVAVMDLSSIEVAIGHRLDGILGYSAFLGVLVELDYPAGEIRLREGTLPEPDGVEILALASRARPYVSLRNEGKYLQALLDTGATGALSLPNLDSMDGLAPPALLGRSHGVGGATRQDGVRLRGSLMMGRYELEQPVILSSKTSGRIGGGMLRHFKVTIDAEHRRARFDRASERPITWGPVYGLSVELDLLDDAWVVTDVYGAAVGGPIRYGDRIFAVGGIQVAELGCTRFSVFRPEEMARGLMGDPEQYSVSLGLWRDGAELAVTTPVWEMLK